MGEVFERTPEEWLEICTAIPLKKRYQTDEIYHSGLFLVRRQLQPLGIGKPGQRIVDVGCGFGRAGMGLVESGAAYTGIDCRNDAIGFCRFAFAPWGDAFRFELLDAQNDWYNPKGKLKASEVRLPLEDGSADAVLAVSLFPYFSSKRQDDTHNYLREMHRILAPGGIAYSTWLRNPPYKPGYKRLTCWPEWWILRAFTRYFRISYTRGGLGNSPKDEWVLVGRKPYSRSSSAVRP